MKFLPLGKLGRSQKSFSFKRLFLRGREQTNIALDIREKSLIVAISELKKGIPTLRFVKEISYPENVKKETPDFEKWLKNICRDLKKDFPGSFFWFLISSQHVKTYYFTIPKTDKSKIDSLVYYSLKKTSELELEKCIYDYTIIGEKKINGTTKLEVFAYVAKKEVVEKIQKLAKKINIEHIGITSYPLSLSNLFRKEKGSVVHMFVGTDWSRIDIYRDGYLVFNRDIKTGFISIAEELIENLKDNVVEIALDTSGEKKASTNVTQDITPDIIKDFFTHLFYEKDYTGPFSNLLSNINIIEKVQSSLQRLILQLRRSLEFYSSSMQNSGVSKIYISGISPLPPSILEDIQSNIGVEIKTLTPISEKLILATHDVKIDVLEECEYAPVIGCSIQKKTDFNFLLTSKDLQKIKLKNIISLSISSFFVVVSIILFLYYIVLYKELNKEIRIYNSYKKKIERIKPLIDEYKLKNIAQEYEKKKIEAKNIAKFNKPISALKDFSRLTPSKIKWTKLDFNIKSNLLKLEVIVESGDTSKMEIANYLLKLKRSPFIKDVKVVKEKSMSISDKSYKVFYLNIKLN